MDIEIDFDKLMRKHKIKKISDKIWNLIREVVDICEKKYDKDFTKSEKEQREWNQKLLRN